MMSCHNTTKENATILSVIKIERINYNAIMHYEFDHKPYVYPDVNVVHKKLYKRFFKF